MYCRLLFVELLLPQLELSFKYITPSEWNKETLCFYLRDFKSGNLVSEKSVIYYNRGKTNYVYLLKALVLLIGKYNNLPVQCKLVLADFLTSQTPVFLYYFHFLVGYSMCFLMCSINDKFQGVSWHLVVVVAAAGRVAGGGG